LVIGIDPYLLNVVQFYAIRHFAGKVPVFVLPIAMEIFPAAGLEFDMVFSMGVLYHRRSPLDHLFELGTALTDGAKLILETLVLAEGAGDVLVPEKRYAKMRNVWFIPSCRTLETWLKRCGYKHIVLLDVTKTTKAEQRSTGWMRFESLSDYLDPSDENFTIEGLPAPRRAIFMAEKG
jgi:tRNA (mo5U34)-methyltransferase